jgi:hypothetical protein
MAMTTQARIKTTGYAFFALLAGVLVAQQPAGECVAADLHVEQPGSFAEVAIDGRLHQVVPREQALDEARDYLGSEAGAVTLAVDKEWGGLLWTVSSQDGDTARLDATTGALVEIEFGSQP